MNFTPYKNNILWLLLIIAVVAAIVIYRMGSPALSFNNEKAVTFIENNRQQETEMKPNSVEAAASGNPSESDSLLSYSTDLRRELPKESRYRSERPLYFRVVFGKEGKDPMLGVVDESAGTGAGYDTAYIDENMNGDLTDEAAKKFPRIERGSRAGELDPRFKFIGPLKGEEKAMYTLYFYTLTRKTYSRPPGSDYPFLWFLDINQWNYFFINGRMALFSSAADAEKGKPIHLGSECRWDISSRIRDGRAMISAGLKDGNGCTLRSIRRAGERLSPTLTLIQDGKVIAEEKMKFG